MDGFGFWSVHSRFKLFLDRQFLRSQLCGVWAAEKKRKHLIFYKVKSVVTLQNIFLVSLVVDILIILFL